MRMEHRPWVDAASLRPRIATKLLCVAYYVRVFPVDATRKLTGPANLTENALSAEVPGGGEPVPVAMPTSRE